MIERPPAARLVTAVAAAAILVVAVARGGPAGAAPATDVPAESLVSAGELVRPEEGEVFRLYRSVLGRHPDRPGFHYWAAARIGGLPLRAVADGFLASREYARRFGSGADGDFLDRVYRNVLGRPGDPAGVAYWLGELAGGLPRTELVLLFSESAEHRSRSGTAQADLPPFRPVVTAVHAADLPHSWRPGCPVAPDRLRAVELDHVDFDGHPRRGTLIVAADVVDEVIAVFRQLFERRYPIAAIQPVDVHGGDDDASMAANNTSAFNCRAVTGGTAWSRHAHGTAIDLNPVQNPYVTDRVVLPPAGADHVDRARHHPAVIRPGDVVTTAFAEAGWRWGGDFVTLRDHQHFERRP